MRDTPGIGEAFSLLTTAPSSDVAPYHNRQVVLLRPDALGTLARSAAPVGDLLQPLPAGSLKVQAA